MSLNCTALMAQSNIVEDAPIGEYLSNISGPVVYLEEDIDSFLDSRYLDDPLFAQWMWTLTLFVAFYATACSLSYPVHMAQQKALKLRVLRLRGFVEPHSLLPLIDQYTDGQHHLSKLIVEFAGFHLIENITDFLQRKYRRTFSVQQGTFQYFICFLLSATLLYAGFVPLYLASKHWNHSFVFYLKTECTLYWTDSSSPTYCCLSPTTSQTEIDIHSLCSADTLQDALPFTFYLKSDRYEWSKGEDAFYELNNGPEWQDGHCFVNDSNFRVRQPLIDCCCSDDSECRRCNDRRNRCGRGCKVHRSCDCHCCYDCANCCGYFWCLCLVTCGGWTGWCCLVCSLFCR